MNAGYVIFLFFNEALFYQVLAYYFRSIKFFCMEVNLIYFHLIN